MTIVSASTIIDATPSAVRETILDWPNITVWDKSYIKTITPLLPNTNTPDLSKTNGKDVVPGDKLHATFWGGEAFLEILENTTETLVWKGVWHGLLAVRSFSYTEAEDGKTIFTQREEAKGFMGGVLVVDGWMGGNLRKKFVKFNEDLKVFCEKKVKL